MAEIVGEGDEEEKGGRERENRSGDEARREGQVCLPDDLLLKVSSLCILISHISRKQGSVSIQVLTSQLVSCVFIVKIICP